MKYTYEHFDAVTEEEVGSNSDEQLVIFENAGGVSVAQITLQDACGRITDATRERAEKHARLIAAAPELLEALQNICKYGQASQLGFDAYAQLDQADVLSKSALAAIAKATA